MEGVLEVFVERVEKAIGKAPEEEEDGDQRDGVDGLAKSELGCFGSGVIADAQ